jgi:hypothetical protein
MNFWKISFWLCKSESKEALEPNPWNQNVKKLDAVFSRLVLLFAGQSGIGTGFSRISTIFPANYHYSTAMFSFITAPRGVR